MENGLIWDYTRYGVRVPVGMHRWKIQKKVIRNGNWRAGSCRERGLPQAIRTCEEIVGRSPDIPVESVRSRPCTGGTIWVDAGKFQLPLYGLPFNLKGMAMDQFFLDRTEVTNLDYKNSLTAADTGILSSGNRNQGKTARSFPGPRA